MTVARRGAAVLQRPNPLVVHRVAVQGGALDSTRAEPHEKSGTASDCAERGGKKRTTEVAHCTKQWTTKNIIVSRSQILEPKYAAYAASHEAVQ